MCNACAPSLVDIASQQQCNINFVFSLLLSWVTLTIGFRNETSMIGMVKGLKLLSGLTWTSIEREMVPLL